MRSLTATVKGVLTSENAPLLVLIQLDFVSGTIRVCNAGYTFAYGGHDWLGLGQVGRISVISEGQELQMYGCTLELSGIPSAYIAEALNPDDYQGQQATIWLAPLDDDYQVLADPIITFQGRMDVMSISLGETATIQLSVESKLIDWERPRVRRYNHEDQISEWPLDMGLQYIPQMVEKELVWGRPSP